jgi:hypothetical protein
MLFARPLLLPKERQSFLAISKYMCSLIALSTKKNVPKIRSYITQQQTFTLGLARMYTYSQPHVEFLLPVFGNWDSAVGIATGYGLDDRGVGVRVPVESRIFSSPRRPDLLWGPSSLLSNGYRGLFSRG